MQRKEEKISSDSYALRPATQAEQRAIQTLVRSARINPVGLNWRRFIVAVDAHGTIIGCGQVKEHRDGSRELASVVVHKVWRKRGVARAIIEKLMAENGPTLWLMCVSRLVPFYEKFGFGEVTAVAAMPPHFRRASRLFNFFSSLFRSKYYLAVMVWDET